MYTKQQQRSLELLEKYFEETPEEEIQAAIDVVSNMKFAGPTVKEYFDNFHLAFPPHLTKEERISTDDFKDEEE